MVVVIAASMEGGGRLEGYQGDAAREFLSVGFDVSRALPPFFFSLLLLLLLRLLAGVLAQHYDFDCLLGCGLCWPSQALCVDFSVYTCPACRNDLGWLLLL